MKDSHGIRYIVHRSWTSHRRWKKWFLRRMTVSLDLLPLQNLLMNINLSELDCGKSASWAYILRTYRTVRNHAYQQAWYCSLSWSTWRDCSERGETPWLWWLLSVLPCSRAWCQQYLWIIVEGRFVYLYHKRRCMLTETLVTDIEIPQIDSQIVGGNVCLLIWVDRDGVYMISMCICVDFAGYSSNDIFLMGHPRKS